MIQWLPLDVNLPALARRPHELALELRRNGVEAPAEEPALLSYRPRRRAVLRLGDHVLKVYASEQDFRRATAGLLAGASLRSVPTAALEAALPGLRLTAQAVVAGHPPPHDPDTVRASAAFVRALHGSRLEGLQSAPPRAQLAAAAASARLASVLVPGLHARLERLVARLECTLPEAGPLVPSHGDFHARQVLRHDGELTLIDFDDMCAAPAAFDLGNYAAHLVGGAEDDLESACAALADLIDGYGERPAGLSWYLASSILRRAPFPFRYLEADWPQRMRAMTAAAESALVA